MALLPCQLSARSSASVCSGAPPVPEIVRSRRALSSPRLNLSHGGVLGAHERKLTRGFQELMSQYLFDAQFCRVRRANKKGVGREQ